MGELEGDGGEDGPKVAPVVEIPRTKEAGPQIPVRETHLRERLSDRRLPRPGKAVEPEYTLVFFIPRPLLELEQDLSPRPLHAPLSVSAEVPSLRNVTNPVKNPKVRSVLLADYYQWGRRPG